MSTTTSEDGAVTAQPTTNEAGNDDGAMVIATDANGTPAMVPLEEANAESPAEEPATESTSTDAEVVSDEAAVEEPAQAEDELANFAKAKGFDPTNLSEGERKALEMARNAEKRMHEATVKANSPQPPEELELTEDPAINAVIERQNNAELKIYVRDWFDANPQMKEHRTELMQIASQRPWLTNLDDVAAHFLASPDRLQQAQQDGGKKALENLAQKQAARPPQAGASNANVYASENVITPQNVYDLVEKNSQRWFEENYKTIQKAMQGES